MGVCKKTVAIIALSFTAMLTGCAKQSEKDTLAEAQFCLDKATNASTADVCMTKIQGLTSKQAYSLRCAAGFIASGITQPANISAALNSMKQNASTASVLGMLAFSSQTLANQTFSDCTASGESGLQLVAAMAKTATVISNLATGSGSIETQMQTAITNIVTNLQSGDPTLQAQAIASATNIGGTIQTVYQTTCSGTVVVNQEMCNSINSAISSSPVPIDVNNSSTSQIGSALLSYWQNLSH
ncbi:MAG: hypothetical protein ACXVCY_02015 [Pseudobdellovibrionaceae bacterium]